MSSQVFSSPRQQLDARRAETVERLFAAGAEELRAVGHEALTIRMVATRAGVSAATAYTYLASKNHLFAELFWRFLIDDEQRVPTGATPLERTQCVTRRLTERLAQDPQLAAAVTSALLTSDPDVERLRLRIGAEFATRFELALAGEAGTTPVNPDVLNAILLAFSGALLQAGMGVVGYEDLGRQLDDVVAVILQGHQGPQHESEQK